MRFRLWRRVRLLPGVSLNLGKKGASLSLGPRGAKVTLSPKGVTTTVGLPGTGAFATKHQAWRTSDVDKHIEQLYKQKEYLEAYSEHTDIRVALNPHQAVGGMWEEIGKLQLDFLVDQGLLPTHKFLDIGCGTLRGGRHFIRYLRTANYTGMDISFKAIEYGKGLVREEGLSDKQPRLLISRNRDLKFKEFSGKTFDYLLAQSVFTHLMPEHIEECFQHIGSIMGTDSRFFFTFIEASAFMQVGRKGFMYPFSFFESLAEKYRFTLADCSVEYSHPRGQKMARLSKLSA